MFIEIDINGIVSKQTYKYYSEEFKQRENNRLQIKLKEQELDKLKPQK